MIDLDAIGAGGGSIAYIDSAAARFHVGPRSAGAEPGPACYGNGGDGADRHRCAGRARPPRPRHFLGGDLPLDADARAQGDQSKRMCRSRSACRQGRGTRHPQDRQLQHGAGDQRSNSVARGIDPRDFALVPFGGAGPLHGVRWPKRSPRRRSSCRLRPASPRRWDCRRPTCNMNTRARSSCRSSTCDEAEFARDQCGDRRTDRTLPARSGQGRHHGRARRIPETRGMPLSRPGLRAARRVCRTARSTAANVGDVVTGFHQQHQHRSMAIISRRRGRADHDARHRPRRVVPLKAGAPKLATGGRINPATPRSISRPHDVRRRPGSSRRRATGATSSRPDDRVTGPAILIVQHNSTTLLPPGYVAERRRLMAICMIRRDGEGPAMTGSVDPISLQVIGGALHSIAEQMGNVLYRMSYSSIIRESQDLGAGLFDRDYNTLCESEFHADAYRLAARLSRAASKRRYRSRRGMPGDCVIHNHPYYGASHSPDIAIVMPVFFGGELVGFSANTAHHVDIGAATPGPGHRHSRRVRRGHAAQRAEALR